MLQAGRAGGTHSKGMITTAARQVPHLEEGGAAVGVRSVQDGAVQEHHAHVLQRVVRLPHKSPQPACQPQAKP